MLPQCWAPRGGRDAGTATGSRRRAFQHTSATAYLLLRCPPRPLGGAAFSSQSRVPLTLGLPRATPQASCGQTARTRTRARTRWRGPSRPPAGQCCPPSASGRSLLPLQTGVTGASGQRGHAADTPLESRGRRLAAVTKTGAGQVPAGRHGRRAPVSST